MIVARAVVAAVVVITTMIATDSDQAEPFCVTEEQAGHASLQPRRKLP